MSLSDRTPSKTVETAYQRWELASLREERGRPRDLGTHEAVARASKSHSEEAMRVHEEGRQAGFKKGLQEGLEKGLAQGLAQAQSEVADLQASYAATLASQVASLQQQAQAQQAQLAEQVLQLSLDMTKAMLKQALHVQPERVLPLIEAALEALPSMRQPGEVKLHPQDLERARAVLTEEMRAVGWRCIADDRVEPGACLVETASNSVDATLATRWQRLQEGLGLLPQPWLDG